MSILAKAGVSPNGKVGFGDTFWLVSAIIQALGYSITA
jgi:hypothetical protein